MEKMVVWTSINVRFSLIRQLLFLSVSLGNINFNCSEQVHGCSFAGVNNFILHFCHFSIQVVTGRFAYWSFRLLSVRLRIREFKICDATVTKTSFKIASSGLLIVFVVMSACLSSKN